MPYLAIIQIVLLVLWYTVEALHNLPAIVVFLPSIIMLSGFLFLGLIFTLVAWASSK